MKKILVLTVAILMAFVAPAFAANPFADVPMNSWAYDAVSQLAASGVVSGYPDGSFKGAQPATRYEIASVVARAMAKIDMEKASKQDVEMLKKLIVEFKDELDALGVKVDKIDARLADVEKGVGKWYFSGQLRFTARFRDDDVTAYSAAGGKSDFSLDRFRWNIKKVVDDYVTVVARVQSNQNNGFDESDNFVLERAYAIVKLPWDSTAYIGKQNFSFEDDYFVADYDGWNGAFAIMTDYDNMNTFRWEKAWGMANFQVFIAHGEGIGVNAPAVVDPRYTPASYNDVVLYGAKLAFAVNEQFKFDLNYIGRKYGDSVDGRDPRYAGTRAPAINNNSDTLWLAGRFNFNPNIGIKAMYYWQSLSWGYGGTWTALGQINGNDNPKAWNVALDIKQDMLKFTSLWIEYAHFGQGFQTPNNTYVWAGGDARGNVMRANSHYRFDTDIWNIYAGQKWNEKWYTYIRYTKFARTTATPFFGGEVSNWGVSARYQYTPALSFELMYDHVTYDQNPLVATPTVERSESDHMIMFRTGINF